MSKLVRLLRQAHAVETGAYNAYEGHWRSLKNKEEREKVESIQKEEWFHRQTVGWMLIGLKSEPSEFLETILYLIGKTISLACYVMGYRAAMWGAKIMEVMGKNIYKNLAQVARDEGYPALAVELDFMQKGEEEHEKYFKSRLKKGKCFICTKNKRLYELRDIEVVSEDNKLDAKICIDQSRCWLNS
jgi:rubrerythrin